MFAMVFARIHQEALFANATLAIQAMLQPQMHAQVRDGSRYTFGYNLQLLAPELQGSLCIRYYKHDLKTLSICFKLTVSYSMYIYNFFLYALR
jgi:hypothetical protein